MMRQKFDQQWSVRKTHASSAEQSRVLRLLRNSSLTLEGLMEGQTLRVEDLLDLQEGHLLTFDYPVDRPIDLLVNGTHKYRAQVVSTGKKRACLIEQLVSYRPAPLPEPAAQGRMIAEGDASGRAAGG
jgi:flagellar motor switch protein FliM